MENRTSSENIPRIIISSIRGKEGKTTVTLAVITALLNAGFRVSVFKVGPDFIDPSYHSSVAGDFSRNLDHFMMGNGVIGRFLKYSHGRDIAVIEGVAGLYDSIDGIGEDGSTAQMAKLLKAPVVIALNGERLNRTAAAILEGVIKYDRNVDVMGVIFTNVVPSQREKLYYAAKEVGIEPLGYVERDNLLAERMTYRHLGLVHAEEVGAESIKKTFDFAGNAINVPSLYKVAREGSGELPTFREDEKVIERRGLRIAILKGRTFTFYYPETLELALAAGDVTMVDPEIEQELNADVVLIGGGFPELYAEQLERNRPLKSSIKHFIEKGGYLYAECGGLMYLCDSIIYRGKEYQMVGAIEGVSEVLRTPVGHGYVIGKMVMDTPIAKEGTTFRGHEFHYSKLIKKDTYKNAVALDRGIGIDGGKDGILTNNAYAQFIHLHPYSFNYMLNLMQSAWEGN